MARKQPTSTRTKLIRSRKRKRIGNVRRLKLPRRDNKKKRDRGTRMPKSEH